MNDFDLSTQQQRRLGFFAALGAYLWWGVVTVVYINHIRSIDSIEIVGHRIIWSLVVLLVLICARGQFSSFLKVLRSRRACFVLFITAMLITVNWLLFTYAVQIRELVQASLGYFMTPLVSVLLSLLVLRERMRWMQWIAISFGALAVGVLAIMGGEFPWIAVGLATTFGVYGLLRKMINVDSAAGLTIECLMIAPLGIAILVKSAIDPESSFSVLWTARDYLTLTWLSAAGVVTAIPLLMFGFAARRLRLVSLSMIQYIGPTCQWLMAVLMYREALDPVRLLACILIWIGLLIYSADMIFNARRTSLRAR